MASLLKSGGRKPVVIGGASVGYGNYKLEGLPENKHLRIMVYGNLDSPYKNHYVNLSLQESENVLTTMASLLVRHGYLSQEAMIDRIKSTIESDAKRF